MIWKNIKLLIPYSDFMSELEKSLINFVFYNLKEFSVIIKNETKKKEAIESFKQKTNFCSEYTEK